MSKLSVADVRTKVQEILEYSREHPRNFVETVELQVTLKNYDTKKDKRFAGSLMLPAVPRPRMTVLVLGDQFDIDRARQLDVPAMSVTDMQMLRRQRHLIKKLAESYDAFIASEAILKDIPRLLGPQLSRIRKFPTPVSHTEDLEKKINDVKSTIKFQLRKVVDIAGAVGNVGMSEEELLGNVMLAINFLVSLLKKGWQNVDSLVIKATMSPPKRLY